MTKKIKGNKLNTQDFCVKYRQQRTKPGLCTGTKYGGSGSFDRLLLWLGCGHYVWAIAARFKDTAAADQHDQTQKKNTISCLHKELI
jgi:hypothetical protein